MGIQLRQTAYGAVTQQRPTTWKSVVGRSILVLVLSVGAVLIGASLWIRRTFGPISIDQMLSNLGGGETTGAEAGYISSFVWQALVLPLGAVFLLVSVVTLSARIVRSSALRQYAVAPQKGPLSRSFGRFAQKARLRKWAPTLLTVGTFAVGAALIVQSLSLPQYIRSITTPLTMDEYYVSPQFDGEQTVLAQDETAGHKNIITIFLESIEDPLSDDSLFEENMLEPVQRVTQDWASVPTYDQYEGGGWTMAGVVGTLCGVPLRGAGVGENDINSNEIGSESADFLPGATCLGDVLTEAGYTSVFLGGADANFASKGNFLRTHGYDQVKDLTYWQDSGETEFSSWGLSDGALMEQAKAEVTALHDAGQPFNLTMLTLDSHEPGDVMSYCPITTDVAMTSVFECSMEQVAGFIEYLDEMGYLEDTVVVLSGDHKKMIAEGGNFYEELASHPNRTIFNRIWSPDGVEIAREEADQLSMYATMLDLLGLGRSDHRAGIGVSALVSSTEAASMLDLPADKYTEMVQSRSADLYAKLWAVREPETIEASE